LESLSGTFETIQIQLGSGILPYLTMAMSSINNILNGTPDDNPLSRILFFAVEKFKMIGEYLGPLASKTIGEIVDKAANFINNNEVQLKNMVDETINFIITHGPTVINIIGEIAKAALAIADGFLKADKAFKDMAGKVRGGGKGGIAGTILGQSHLGQIGGLISSTGDLFKGNASGTSNFGGGFSTVGENGPEIVRMPKGASVETASQSQSQVNNNSQSTHVTNVFKFSKLSDLKNQLAFN